MPPRIEYPIISEQTPSVKSSSPPVVSQSSVQTEDSQSPMQQDNSAETNALFQQMFNVNKRILENQKFHHSLIDEVLLNLNNQQETLNNFGNNTVYQQQVINQLLVQRNREDETPPVQVPSFNANEIENIIRNSIQSVLHRDQAIAQTDRNVFQQLIENGEESSSSAMDIVPITIPSTTTNISPPLLRQIENAQSPLPQQFVNNTYNNYYYPPIQSTENRTINQNLLTLNREDLPNNFFLQDAQQQPQDLVMNTNDGSIVQQPPPIFENSNNDDDNIETEEDRRRRFREDHDRRVNLRDLNPDAFDHIAGRNADVFGIEQEQQQRVQELALFEKKDDEPIPNPVRNLQLESFASSSAPTPTEDALVEGSADRKRRLNKERYQRQKAAKIEAEKARNEALAKQHDEAHQRYLSMNEEEKKTFRDEQNKNIVVMAPSTRSSYKRLHEQISTNENDLTPKELHPLLLTNESTSSANYEPRSQVDNALIINSLSQRAALHDTTPLPQYQNIQINPEIALQNLARDTLHPTNRRRFENTSSVGNNALSLLPIITKNDEVDEES